MIYKDLIEISNYYSESLHFCANILHFCQCPCKARNCVIFCRQKEVNDMKNNKKLIAEIARKAAEKALRRDANSTTCLGFYQPKAPAALKRFKNVK